VSALAQGEKSEASGDAAGIRVRVAMSARGISPTNFEEPVQDKGRRPARCRPYARSGDNAIGGLRCGASFDLRQDNILFRERNVRADFCRTNIFHRRAIALLHFEQIPIVDVQ
jgi:hypothetical protein